MNLADLIARRIAGKVAVVSPDDFGDMLFAVDDGQMVPIDVQRRCWRAGTFYTLGGRVEAHEAWLVEDSPDTPDARRFEMAYGQPVTQIFRRDPLRFATPFPADPPTYDFG